MSDVHSHTSNGAWGASCHICCNKSADLPIDSRFLYCKVLNISVAWHETIVSVQDTHLCDIKPMTAITTSNLVLNTLYKPMFPITNRMGYMILAFTEHLHVFLSFLLYIRDY